MARSCASSCVPDAESATAVGAAVGAAVVVVGAADPNPANGDEPAGSDGTAEVPNGNAGGAGAGAGAGAPAALPAAEPNKEGTAPALSDAALVGAPDSAAKGLKGVAGVPAVEVVVVEPNGDDDAAALPKTPKMDALAPPAPSPAPASLGTGRDMFSRPNTRPLLEPLPLPPPLVGAPADRNGFTGAAAGAASAPLLSTDGAKGEAGVAPLGLGIGMGNELPPVVVVVVEPNNDVAGAVVAGAAGAPDDVPAA